MGAKLRISYDPDADALYVELKSPTAGGAGQTEVDEEGVIIDTDELGQPRGFEFLAVRSKGIPLASIPEQTADKIRRFIDEGYLQTSSPVKVEYGPD